METTNRQESTAIRRRMDNKLRRLSQTERPSIFRVHQSLRRNNPLAYSPTIVSIGPYHHENPDLSPMEDVKLTYLRSFLARREEDSVGNYVAALQQLKKKARNCYAHLPKINDDGDDGSFLETMLLDGCFVIDFLRRFSEHETLADDDPITQLRLDESSSLSGPSPPRNQVPYFVLSKLYDLNEMDEEKEPLTSLATMAFSDMFPKLCPASALSCDGIEENHEVKHLLHLVHVLCGPAVSSEVTSVEGDSFVGREVIDPMHCVKDLEEAGIRFKKLGKVLRRDRFSVRR